MPRAIKQLLYGLLFISILSLLGWWLWTPANEVEIASCTDGIQNQEESGVDCGGPCDDCELRDLRLQIGGVDIIEVGEKSSLLVKVTNPSENFGVENVQYQFQVLGALGASLEDIEGTLNMGGGEEKYVTAVGLNIEANDIDEVVFSIEPFEFVSVANLLEYDFDVDAVETTFPEQSVRVDGLITNESSLAVAEVIITAVFYTDGGDIANVGEAFISNVKAFEERGFAISIPRNDFFINPDLTEISWRAI